MRTTGIIAFVACCFLLAPLGAEEKQATKGAPENAPMKDAPDKPPKPEFKSALDEIEGKNLGQWIKDLSDGDPSVREKAIAILPVYGPSAAPYADKLVTICHNPDEDLGPRSKAIMALGVMELQKEDVPKVVAAMAQILEKNGEDLAAKLQAALALTRFGHDEAKLAIPGLIAGANDRGSWQIRKASILALRRIGGDPKNGPHREVTKTLLFRAKRDQSFQVRIEAIQALGYMGPPSAPTTRDEVLDGLKELTNVNDNALPNDQIIAVWAHVSRMALTKVTDEEIKTIIKKLSSSHVPVRGEAVLGLGTLGVKAKVAVPDLVKVLDDKDLGVAILACWALVSIGDKDPKAIDAMEKLRDKKDQKPAARDEINAAIEALKNSKKAEFAEKKDDKATGKTDGKTQPNPLPRR
jgi:HEAT repeat protein